MCIYIYIYSVYVRLTSVVCSLYVVVQHVCAIDVSYLADRNGRYIGFK